MSYHLSGILTSTAIPAAPSLWRRRDGAHARQRVCPQPTITELILWSWIIWLARYYCIFLAEGWFPIESVLPRFSASFHQSALEKFELVEDTFYQGPNNGRVDENLERNMGAPWRAWGIDENARTCPGCRNRGFLMLHQCGDFSALFMSEYA